MRILFLSSDFPSPWEPGRAPFNLALVRALRRTNRVQVVAPISWLRRIVSSHKRKASIGVEMDVFHPTYFYPPKLARWKYDLFYWHSIRRLLRRLIHTRRPELVLAYWAHPDGAAAVRAARECGAKSAIVVGGSDVLLITHDRMRRAAVIEALRGADYVVAVNQHLRQAIIALGIEAAKVHAWSQGIDVTIFCPRDRMKSRLRTSVLPRAKAILWVGRMEAVKGLDVLLRAMPSVRERCPEAQLFLIGDGSLRRSLERQSKRLKLGDAVHFIGAVRPAALGDWYRSANVTVLPSRSEGLPNVLRESLACGTPFVASRVGGIEEIARLGIDRLVEPNRPRALADALIATLSDPRSSEAPSLPTWDESAEALLKLVDSSPAKLRVSVDGTGARTRAIEALAESITRP